MACPDWRKLNRTLHDLGGRVVPLAGTGEIQYSHPAVNERPRANARRKDPPRHLVAFVRKVQRRCGSGRRATNGCTHE